MYTKQFEILINESGIFNQHKTYSNEEVSLMTKKFVETVMTIAKMEDELIAELSKFGKSLDEQAQTVPATKKRGCPRKNNLQLDLFSSIKKQRKESSVQDDSTTIPLSEHKAPSTKTGGYTQDHSLTIPNSNQMRMSKRGGKMRPMVLDYDFAHQMFNDKFTHVQIVSNISNPDEKFLVFKEEDVRTRAPHKNPLVSRLHIYGYGKNNEVSTYSINSVYFQKTIASALAVDLDKLSNDAEIVIQHSDVKTDSNGNRFVKLERVVNIKEK